MHLCMGARMRAVRIHSPSSFVTPHSLWIECIHYGSNAFIMDRMHSRACI